MFCQIYNYNHDDEETPILKDNSSKIAQNLAKNEEKIIFSFLSTIFAEIWEKGKILRFGGTHIH